MLRTVLILVLLLFQAVTALAADAIPEQGLVLNFNDADIRSVIKSVGKMTGKNFIVDPNVKGKVTIISSQAMNEKELYGIFLSILQVHDLVTVESGDIIKIIPLEQGKQNFTLLDDGAKPIPEKDRYVTRIFRLEYSSAEKMVPILRPLVHQKSFLAAFSDSNCLIIIDSAANVDRVVKIIQKLDQPDGGEIEVIKLSHASARDVAGVVEGLEAKNKKKAADPQFWLVADERTNCILLAGAENIRMRIKSLIAHLDKPIEVEGSTQVIFLSYAKAKDLVPILSGVTPVEDKAKQQVLAAGGQAAGRDRNVIIQADEATNALIINAPPAAMKALQSVIQKLDIRRTQVQIEAVIVEISTDRAANLGVQWRSTTAPVANNSGIAGGTNFGTTGINAVAANPLAAGVGLNLGFFNGVAEFNGVKFLNLGGLLSVLASNDDVNILSTPSLVTLDNQEAEIVVGDNVPFATGTYTSTGNSSNPTNPFTTYERRDVGVKLKVKPQINEGNVVRLDINQEISKIKNVTGMEVGLQLTNTRTIKTSVMVEDGKILVLGGLIDDAVEESVSKVPILGDIPYLGALFRYTSNTHNKRNLMVFLRPVILRDEESGSRITFDKYDYMRRLQLNYKEEGLSLLPDAVVPVLPEKNDQEGSDGK